MKNVKIWPFWSHNEITFLAVISKLFDQSKQKLVSHLEKKIPVIWYTHRFQITLICKKIQN